MIIIDKTNNIIESSDSVSLEYIVSRYNQTISTLFFDSVSIVSLNNLIELHSEDLITDEEMKKAKDDFKKLMGSEKLKDIHCFVFVDTEKTRDIVIKSPLEIEEYSCEMANDMINNCDCDYDIDIEIVPNIDDIMERMRLCEDDNLFEEMKRFLNKNINYNPPTQVALAAYLGVTKGAVSQYEKTKKDLMLKGLWVEKRST